MSINLPFNTTPIRDLFIPLSPGDKVDDLPGFWVAIKGTELLVSTGLLHSLPEYTLPESIVPETEPIIIGLWHGRPLRALKIAGDIKIPNGFVLLPFQGADQTLDIKLSTIAGRANQILHWESRSLFCSHCGSGLSRISGGWGKSCVSCGQIHFPHIHPCIIVLVKRNNDLLLIRNAAWNIGHFSLVAGFTDFGESLEECVQREVFEEAGIEIKNIRYVGSQSWPFPSQLMIGFVADYAGGEIKPDGVEVIEAGWFKEDNLPSKPGSKRSISRWIMENFAK